MPPIEQPSLPPYSVRLQILVADQGMVFAIGRSMSRTNALPNRRRYSRLNWEGLS
jgi:hypothetical protein